MSSTRKAWDINEGFETFPPNTKEYLYIEVDAPDYVLTYTLAHTKTSADFSSLGISMNQLDNYKEGEHVFVVNFVMQADYSETPTKIVKLSAPAYLDMVNGTGYHILALADKRKKKYKRSMQNMLSDQV